MATSDALLLGRVTYEALTAYWPHQPGKDIRIVGSGALLRSLLAGEPLDELGLIVHPLVLGSGKRLLGDGLSEGAEGGGLEDVRHGHSLPHLPAGGGVPGRVLESPGGRILVTRPDIRVSPGIQQDEKWRIK
jgi:hypothetical protein